MYYTKCGALNSNDGRFCTVCGYQLVDFVDTSKRSAANMTPAYPNHDAAPYQEAPGATSARVPAPNNLVKRNYSAFLIGAIAILVFILVLCAVVFFAMQREREASSPEKQATITNVQQFNEQLEEDLETTDIANIRSSYAEVAAQALMKSKDNYSVTVNKVQTQSGWQHAQADTIAGIRINDLESTANTIIEYKVDDKGMGIVLIDGNEVPASELK